MNNTPARFVQLVSPDTAITLLDHLGCAYTLEGTRYLFQGNAIWKSHELAWVADGGSHNRLVLGPEHVKGVNAQPWTPILRQLGETAISSLANFQVPDGEFTSCILERWYHDEAPCDFKGLCSQPYFGDATVILVLFPSTVAPGDTTESIEPSPTVTFRVTTRVAGTGQTHEFEYQVGSGQALVIPYLNECDVCLIPEKLESETVQPLTVTFRQYQSCYAHLSLDPIPNSRYNLAEKRAQRKRRQETNMKGEGVDNTNVKKE